jgi:amidase
MGKFKDALLLDATAQAELIRKKEIQPIELIESSIENIEKLNPKLNAVVTTMYDQARNYARNTIPDGVFSGVPFLMKDIGSAVGGVPMSMGTSLLKDYVPHKDSELTIRFKKAGLIILGKTNIPEFGLVPTTEPKLFGATHNPWNLNRTTGGSSGGSAASVAAGFTAMAHANDGGGSIRIPASCCGLFGLKPTRGRNPLGPDFGDIMSGMVCEHAVTKSVRDSAALLDATSGPDIGDPYWAPPKKRPFLEETKIDPDQLRIAFSTEITNNGTVSPECIDVVNKTAKLCEDLGHVVTETTPQITVDPEKLIESFTIVWLSGCVSTIDSITRISGIPADPGFYEPLTWALYEKGRQYSASDYLNAITLIQRVSREIARFFEDYDILLTPVLAEPPVHLGTFDVSGTDPMKAWDRVIEFAPFTSIYNATGQPAMSVPLFWNKKNLPIGSHFVGRFGDEATLFQLASQLEQARPWIDRKPIIHISML